MISDKRNARFTTVTIKPYLFNNVQLKHSLIKFCLIVSEATLCKSLKKTTIEYNKFVQRKKLISLHFWSSKAKQFKKFEIEMNSLGNILYECTLLHIICEHLHDLYTLNSLSGWKGLKKFISKDSFNSFLYILFSMSKAVRVKTAGNRTCLLMEDNLKLRLQSI